MRKTVTRPRLLMIAVLLMASVSVFAQGDLSRKLSVTTQMFLHDRDAKTQVVSTPAARRKAPLRDGKALRPVSPRTTSVRYLPPVQVNGTKYVSAFIRLADNASTSALEQLGVQVQSKFKGGLVTALIPVDKVEAVAGLDAVERVNVAEQMRPQTDQARKATKVSDVLNGTAAAKAAGLSTKYDGKGVIIGVIDGGIDYQHIAFKDANGKSRIKAIFNAPDGVHGTEYTDPAQIDTVRYDVATSDHGTHVSSIAGGSSVIIDGANVTVTNAHDSATYGGMAPGADLYLAGINTLGNVTIANALQKMIAYADSHNEPIVVNCSFGSSMGPRNGTGEGTSDLGQVFNQYFGPDHPNHIAVFSTGNDAGRDILGEGGGMYTTATATPDEPLSDVIGSYYYNGVAGGYYYEGTLADVWTREPFDGSLNARILVIDNQDGEVVQSIDVTPTSRGNTVTIPAGFYVDSYGSSTAGQVTAYVSQSNTGRQEVELYTDGLFCTSNTGYTSNYRIGFEVYPDDGSVLLDCWGGDYSYFTTQPAVEGYNWAHASDDCSVSNEATMDNIITVGAYVTKNSIVDYTGTTASEADEFPTIGEIADFSCYEAKGVGPTGKQLPTITAPGATIVSAVNHYNTESEYMTETSNGTGRVNENTTYPYGNMDGTSMSTPCVAGIVALWLQAAKEKGEQLTNSDVELIMQETAFTDAFTYSGAYASHFGYGKIDALAGLRYIINGGVSETLEVNPSSLSFSTAQGGKLSKSIIVKQVGLLDNITVTLDDPDGFYSVADSTIGAIDGTTELGITFDAKSSGTHDALLILTSGELADTVALSGTVIPGGTAQSSFLNIANYATIGEPTMDYTKKYLNKLYVYTEDKENNCGWLTLPFFGVYYESANQQWTSDSQTDGLYYTKNANTIWSSLTPFQGSSAYYINPDSVLAGYGYTWDGQPYVDYYVTNCTEVRVLYNGVGYGYETDLDAYECTGDENGELTPADNAAFHTSGTATGTDELVITGLDPNKIYDINWYVTFGRFFEVAFKTPLPDPTGIESVNADRQAKRTGIYDLQGRRLNKTEGKGVYIINGRKVVK